MVISMRVHTLGDSVLDNLYWMVNGEGTNLDEAKDNSVEGQLQKQLGQSYTVVSRAYDGFTTENVLKSGVVGGVLFGHYEDGSIFSYRLKTYVCHKLRQDVPDKKFEGKIYTVCPLEQLRVDIQQKPAVRHFVVLSVGGNDFREKLFNPIGLLTSVSKVQQQYFRILDELEKMKQDTKADIVPILMFLYPLDLRDQPYRIYTILRTVSVAVVALQIGSLACSAALTFASVAGRVSKKWAAASTIGALLTCFVTTRAIPFKVTLGILKGQDSALTCLGALLEKFYRPIVNRSVAMDIPILDLPNTFDPHNSSLYLAQIEPSAMGGALIAEGLAKVIKEYQPSTNGNQIYSKRPGTDAYVGQAKDDPDAYEVHLT